MRKILFFGFLFIILCSSILISCGSYDLDDLQKGLKISSNDGIVTQLEFDSLLKKLNAEESSKLARYKSPEQLYSYAKKYLALQKMQTEIWNPTRPQKKVAFNLNVYIDNSYSIDGYFNGVTELGNKVFSTIGSASLISKSVNLNYINKDIHQWAENAGQNEILMFLNNLKPGSTKKDIGDRGVSNIGDFIKEVLEKTNDTNVSILISDFVFSAGSGVNAQQYIDQQKTIITLNVSQKLKKQNLAIVAYQLLADFNGFYYDQNNKTNIIKGKRPYYIWIIGSTDQVEDLLNRQIIKENSTDVLNKLFFKKHEEIENVSYKISKVEKLGNFSPGKKPFEIDNAKPDDNGSFAFSIAVNYDNVLTDAKYFLDPVNYILNDGFTIKPRLLTAAEKNKPAFKGFTHLLNVKTDKLQEQQLEIKAIARTPSWVARSSSKNDINIANDKVEQSKTFGFDYLVDGVAEGFNTDPNPENNVIFKLKVKINK